MVGLARRARRATGNLFGADAENGLVGEGKDALGRHRLGNIGPELREPGRLRLKRRRVSRFSPNHRAMAGHRLVKGDEQCSVLRE